MPKNKDMKIVNGKIMLDGKVVAPYYSSDVMAGIIRELIYKEFLRAANDSRPKGAPPVTSLDLSKKYPTEVKAIIENVNFEFLAGEIYHPIMIYPDYYKQEVFHHLLQYYGVHKPLTLASRSMIRVALHFKTDIAKAIKDNASLLTPVTDPETLNINAKKLVAIMNEMVPEAKEHAVKWQELFQAQAEEEYQKSERERLVNKALAEEQAKLEKRAAMRQQASEKYEAKPAPTKKSALSKLMPKASLFKKSKKTSQEAGPPAVEEPEVVAAHTTPAETKAQKTDFEKKNLAYNKEAVDTTKRLNALTKLTCAELLKLSAEQQNLAQLNGALPKLHQIITASNSEKPEAALEMSQIQQYAEETIRVAVGIAVVLNEAPNKKGHGPAKSFSEHFIAAANQLLAAMGRMLEAMVALKNSILVCMGISNKKPDAVLFAQKPADSADSEVKQSLQRLSRIQTDLRSLKPQ